jgi:hypothetical protein
VHIKSCGLKFDSLDAVHQTSTTIIYTLSDGTMGKNYKPFEMLPSLISSLISKLKQILLHHAIDLHSFGAVKSP